MVCTPALPGVDDPDDRGWPGCDLIRFCVPSVSGMPDGWPIPSSDVVSFSQAHDVSHELLLPFVEFVGHYSAIAWATTKTDFSWRKDVVIWCLESGQPNASRHGTWKRLWAVYSWIRLEDDLVSLSLSLLWLYSIVLLSLCITLTFLRLSSFDCFFLFHSSLFNADTH